MGSGQWQEPPEDVRLLPGEVHVWRASLDQPEPRAQQLSATLSTDERERAARFVFDKDRRHFSVGRGMLRAILGRYLKLAPEQLRFCYNPFGKPGLATPSSAGQVHFNLAHSGGLALYAVTRVREVGIDLEYMRPMADAEQIVKRYFSARERAMYANLDASQQQRAFFDYWTCKEAYIKAVGRGLDYPLNAVEVALTPGQAPGLLSLNGNQQHASRWHIQTLTPFPACAAAAAIEERGCQFKYWEFLA